MRRLARLSVFLPVVLVGCRDDVVDPSDVHFEPQCDEQGPVELLRLGDDEQVGRVARVGDEVDGDIHVLVISTDDAQGDAPTGRRNVVVDRCGEEATELAPGITSVTRWGAVLVGCLDGDLVRLSRYDDPSPTLLARRGCAARAVGDDLWVTIEAEPGATEGRLVSLELDGSGVEVRELLDGAVVGGPGTFTAPTVIDDRAFVRTTDFALVSVSPRTHDVRIELEQADAWSTHPHALAYRAPVVDPDEPTPIIVRDRRTGAEQTLDAEIPASWRFGWFADGVLGAGPSLPSLTYRWFRLDPLRELVPPEGMRIETVRSDGLVWLSQLDETNGDTSFFRWREGQAPQHALTCTYCGVAQAYRGDFIEVMVQTRYEHLVDLWRLDDDGGPARPLASAINREYHVMGDDRVLTVPVGHSFDHGPLQLHDGSGGPTVTLAPRVHRHAAGLTWLYDVPDEVLYVADPSASHGTHALFRAKLSL